MNFSLPAILTFAALTGLASASVVNIDFNHAGTGINHIDPIG